MRSAKSTGRIIGALLVIQLAGLIVPFILLLPMLAPPGFLENAAGVSTQIKVAVFLLFANCALTIAIAIIALPVFRHYSQPLSIWLFALSIIMFLLQAIDNTHLLSMVSLSQEYANTGASNPDLFHALASSLSATRRWTHYSELLAIDAWMFVFYGLLWRASVVPRVLAVVGLLTVAFHTFSIPVPLFLGYRGVPWLGVLMAFSNVAVGGWLLIKGIKAPAQEDVNG